MDKISICITQVENGYYILSDEYGIYPIAEVALDDEAAKDAMLSVYRKTLNAVEEKNATKKKSK